MGAPKLHTIGKALFMAGISNQEIATTLGVSDTTVSNWVVKGEWREERASGMAQKETIERGILNLIDYQLEALNKQVKTNRDVDDVRPLDKGEVDALGKLFATVKGKELTFAQVVGVVREIVQHLTKHAPDLAKAIVPHTNDYLATKRDLTQ